MRDIHLNFDSVRKDILVQVDMSSVNSKFNELGHLIAEVRDSHNRLNGSINDQFKSVTIRFEKEIAALRDATARLSADLQLELKNQIQTSITSIKFPDFEGMINIALNSSSSNYDGKFGRLEASFEAFKGQILGNLTRESQAREDLRKNVFMRIDQIETHIEEFEGFLEELNTFRASLNSLSIEIKTNSSNNAKDLSAYMDLIKKLEAKFLQDFSGLDILIQGLKRDYQSLHGVIINVDFKASIEKLKADFSAILSASQSTIDHHTNLIKGIQMEICDINGKISNFIHLEGLIGKISQQYKVDIADLTAQFNLIQQSFKGLNLDAVIGLHIKGLDEKLISKYNVLVDRVNAV